MSDLPRMSKAASLPIGGKRNEAILFEGCQLERENEALRELLVDARERLDGAQSGYIPSCAEDEQWNTQRDALVSAIDAAIKEQSHD